MKTSIKYLMVMIFAILSLLGCKKVVTPVTDTVKPAITIVSPSPGQTFSAGSTIAFQATFSDNINLKSYEIGVSQKIAGGLILKIIPTSVPFSYTKSTTAFDAGLKQQEIRHDINIPANSTTTNTAPGIYNFRVTFSDSSDNVTSITVEINIK
jgi:hypothetical protein